jgi:hypothetical protein
VGTITDDVASGRPVSKPSPNRERGSLAVRHCKSRFVAAAYNDCRSSSVALVNETVSVLVVFA